MRQSRRIWAAVTYAPFLLSIFSTLGYEALGANPLKLTILHTNDIHSHLEESNKYGGKCFDSGKNNTTCVGGVARIVTKVKELREEYPDALFMNAGDFFQGTPYYTLLKQAVISTVMAAMGYNFVCLGNHEFDDGPKNLAPFLKKMNESNVTVVGTNTNFSMDEDLKEYDLVKSATTTINGTDIGILGAVIPATKYTSSPGPYVEFYEEIDSFKIEVKKLKGKGVNIIIAITHSGFEREKDIMEAVPEIDVLVGGHTNTFLYNGTDYPKENKPDGLYPTVVHRTNGNVGVIVQDFWFGKFLGVLHVAFDENGVVIGYGGNPVLLNSNVTEDQNMTDILKPFKENITELMARVIGRTKVLMEHASDFCRLQECNMGNLVADAYYDYYLNKETTEPPAWSHLSGAIVNAGSIRTALRSFSNITWGDVVTTLPYGNSLVVVTLSGSQLLQVFEHAVTNYTTNNQSRQGRFLHVSGFRVQYDLTRPNGARVANLRVLCANCSVPHYERLDCDRNYSIVAVNYLTNGGDGFKIFKSTNVSDVGPIEYEALEAYVVKMSPIKTPNEGRIKITWDESDAETVQNLRSNIRHPGTLDQDT
ncbi:5'-nucleotidase-like [Haemaphysalis longicornis]